MCCVRMRRSKEAREEVLTRGGRYQTVQAKSELDQVVTSTNFCSIDNPGCESCQ